MHPGAERSAVPPLGRRRLFLTPSEVPARLVGALRGDPVALRRILGARRAGRIGAVMFCAGLLAAFPPGGWLVAIAVHLALAAVLRRTPPSAPPLTLRERVKLSLWTTAPVLLAFAPLRWLAPASLLPGLAALAVGHAILLAGLRTGLRSQPAQPRAADR